MVVRNTQKNKAKSVALWCLLLILMAFVSVVSIGYGAHLLDAEMHSVLYIFSGYAGIRLFVATVNYLHKEGKLDV